MGGFLPRAQQTFKNAVNMYTRAPEDLENVQDISCILTLVVGHLVGQHILQFQPDAFLALVIPSLILANLDISFVQEMLKNFQALIRDLSPGIEAPWLIFLRFSKFKKLWKEEDLLCPFL